MVWRNFSPRLPTLLVLLSCGSMGFAQSPAVSLEAIEKASKAVVLLRGTSDSGAIVGSGFVTSPDGKIATNLHVIRDMKSGGVQLSSGEIFDSFVVLAFDERRDLAIIQIAGFDLLGIDLGNSNEIKVGEPVVAIGSPRGLQGTVTAGIVSAVRDDAVANGFKLIQTDAAANPGNSGGPLVNSRGQVIGVVTSKFRASEGLNFAVPINYVRGLLGAAGKPINLEGLRAALRASPSDNFKETDAFPLLWKSLVSGKKFKIRAQNDFVYVEWIVPEEAARVGVFSAWELRKGSNGYTGNARHVIACSYDTDDWARFSVKTVNKKCTFENPVEFSLFTPSRIEGRSLSGPSDVKLNCRKCTYNQAPAWQRFAWIPE